MSIENIANDTILEIKDLTVHYVTEEETVEAVNDLSLSVKRGKSLGLVGETGAGKTTTALSILQLLPERTGVILDALTYESYENILPIFYDVTLSQKGLRNEESIEMLQIIRDTRFFDLGDAYGWTTKVQNSVRNALDKGNAGVASLIAAEKPAIDAAIKATMELLK